MIQIYGCKTRSQNKVVRSRANEEKAHWIWLGTNDFCEKLALEFSTQKHIDFEMRFCKHVYVFVSEGYCKHADDGVSVAQ